MEKDNLISELRTALDVALLKHNKMSAVASDKQKMLYAFGVLAVAAVASGLGTHFFGWFTPSWGYTLGMMFYQVISAVIGIYLMSIIAKAVFKGQAKHDGFFRVMAYGAVVTWVAIFPPLSIIGGIWGLVILFVSLKVIHKLTTGGAIGTIVLTIIAMIIVMAILSPVLAMLGIGGFGLNSMSLRGGDVDYLNMYDDGFRMDVNGTDGEGSVEMKDGKMVIEGADGESVEISIPSFN